MLSFIPPSHDPDQLEGILQKICPGSSWFRILLNLEPIEISIIQTLHRVT